jgi:hypothetical protein
MIHTPIYANVYNRVYMCYRRTMPKKRVNLYLEVETYELAKKLFDKYPFLGNVSGLVDSALYDFVQNIGPKVERAEQGDREALLEIIDQNFRPLFLQNLTSDLYQAEALSKEEITEPLFEPTTLAIKKKSSKK